jgi:hypothetical protein
MKMLHKSGIEKIFMTQNVFFFNLVREQDSLLKALRKSCELTESHKFRLHLRMQRRNYGSMHRSHKHSLPGTQILCSSSRASGHRHVPQCPQGTNLSELWKQNFILKVAVSMWKN